MSRGVSSGFPYFLFYIKKIICSVFSVHFSLITWTGTSIFVFLGILLFLSNIFSPDRGWSDIGRPLLVVFHVCWVYTKTQCGVLYLVCRALNGLSRIQIFFSVLCVPKIPHLSPEKTASFCLMISADFDKSASDLTMQSCM